jgi:hypothetical protein
MAENVVHQIKVLAHCLALAQEHGAGAQGQPTPGKMSKFNTRRNRLAGLLTGSDAAQITFPGPSCIVRQPPIAVKRWLSKIFHG